MKRNSAESEELGKHKDYDPQKGLPFGVRKKFEEGALFDTPFTNGDVGKPWLVTLMVYSHSENFRPDFRMGTLFYHRDESFAHRATCKEGRIVLFEGDIIHAIERSTIPSALQTWRVSFVYKLCFNPSSSDQSIKSLMKSFLST